MAAHQLEVQFGTLIVLFCSTIAVPRVVSGRRARIALATAFAIAWAAASALGYRLCGGLAGLNSASAGFGGGIALALLVRSLKGQTKSNGNHADDRPS
jgi:hypothetical protein